MRNLCICIIQFLLFISALQLDNSLIPKRENPITLEPSRDMDIIHVSVLVVVDIEFSNFNKDWKGQAETIVGKATKVFYEQSNICFNIQEVIQWDSRGENSSEILQDLENRWKASGFDFVIGISRDSKMDRGGAAKIYTSKPSGSAVSLVNDQGAQTWRALIHELSHNFGLEHDDLNSGLPCIMNYNYLYRVKTWDKQHFQQLEHNKLWYRH